MYTVYYNTHISHSSNQQNVSSVFLPPIKSSSDLYTARVCVPKIYTLAPAHIKPNLKYCTHFYSLSFLYALCIKTTSMASIKSAFMVFSFISAV